MAAPLLKYAIGNAASTTTSSSMTTGSTTTPLTSTTNFQAATTPGEGMILLDEGAATEELAYSTGISGGSLTTPLANRGVEGGSAQAHASGASVKGVMTAGMWNDLVGTLTNVLVQSTGLLDTTKVVDLTTAQTLTNKTLTSPVLTTPQINDTSSDHQYIFAGSELVADRTVTLPLLTGNDDFVFEDHTQTVTNKRITQRVGTVADAATITPTADSADLYTVTALAQAATIAIPSGTPTNGQKLVLRLKDNATGRALTWTTSAGGYRVIGTTLPTTTVASKTHYIGCIYNSADSFWDVVAVVAQA